MGERDPSCDAATRNEPAPTAQHALVRRNARRPEPGVKADRLRGEPRKDHDRHLGTVMRLATVTV
jgi:hypothetical protein